MPSKARENKINASVSSFSKLLGEKIKHARKAARLSQKKLARALQVSDKAISSYEVGRTKPNLETLEKLSKVVKKPLSYFGKEDPPPDIQIEEKLIRIEKELQEVKELLRKQKN